MAPQRVSVRGGLSAKLALDTGTPQGCVRSAVLFSIYTHEILCNNANLTLVRSAVLFSIYTHEILCNNANLTLVRSAVLFSIYTHEILCNNANLTLVQFADDLALIARLKDEFTLTQYLLYMDSLLSWFDDSFQSQETKEFIVHGGRAGAGRVLVN